MPDLGSIGEFAAAVSLLLFAHIIRSVRWRVILKHAGLPMSNLKPLAALSVGYLVNTLLPFRIGEIVRCGLLAYTTRSSLAAVLATVVFERTTDLIVVVAVAAATLSALHGQLSIIRDSGLLAVAVLCVGWAVDRSRWAKRGIWWTASIFNTRIKTGILHFWQVFADLFGEQTVIASKRFWLLSLGMWSCYAASLWLFALSFDGNVVVQAAKVYLAPISASAVTRFDLQDGLLALYLVLPIPVIIAYAYCAGLDVFSRVRDAFRHATRIESLTPPLLRSTAEAFGSIDQYAAYLDRRFAGRGGMIAEFEDRGIGNGLLHRIFHGGSGAITALVEIDGQYRVRKFATGEIGRKLSDQHRWLQAHSNLLPTVSLLSHSSQGDDHSYDMAYIGGTRDLYEGIHTDTIEASAKTLTDVLETFKNFHAKKSIENASDEVVRGYIDAKVVKNFQKIRTEFADLFEHEAIFVNGRLFEMATLRVFASDSWLSVRLNDRRQAEIHGDLTIENVLLTPTGDRWFLIDPNPDNGFQSPLIDFAKLMQSLHLGYETLHRDPRASWTPGRLSVSIHRSFQYETLLEHLTNSLATTYGQDGLQQIYLHEMVNYLRLIPYQIRHGREAGLAFFGCLCILMQDYESLYPGDLAS